jgi:hypothetical protein
MSDQPELLDKDVPIAEPADNIRYAYITEYFEYSIDTARLSEIGARGWEVVSVLPSQRYPGSSNVPIPTFTVLLKCGYRIINNE